MKALYYDRFDGPVRLERLPDPTPRSDSVIIEVRASGLCLSDWHGWKGHDSDIQLPHVPGHEFSGAIVEVGSRVGHWHRGERVTVPFVGGCGHCDYCLEQDPQVCPDQFQAGFTAWGSFASYVEVRYADFNLVRLPDFLSFDEAAILGCRFGTAYRAVKDQAKVKPGQWIVVHGCGGLGLSAVQIAKISGARVIGVDPNPASRERALRLGADHVLDPFSGELVHAVTDITSGGAHISMDAIGNEQVAVDSVHCLRRRGKHIQVGLLVPGQNYPKIPMEKVLAHELEIIGSHGIQAFKYAEMFSFIRQNEISLESYISDRVDLETAASLLPHLNENQTAGTTLITSF